MIYIGIATYDGKIHQTTVGGLFNVGYGLGKARTPVCLDVIPHDPFIGHARDLMAHRFLQIPDATDLVMIDADVGFGFSEFESLMKIDADVVCGAYRYKEDRKRYPVAPMQPLERKGNLLKLAFGPGGFMRIRRKVLEKIAETAPKYVDDAHGEMVQFFPFGPQNGYWKGEDANFYMLARNAGFDCWLLQGLELKHTGEKTYTGAFSLGDEGSIVGVETDLKVA